MGDKKQLGTQEIWKRLPHRYPFLMIDRVLDCSAKEVIAVKNVTVNEGFFCGHFPAEPIMPGVLIGECMAQSAAFIGEANEEGRSAAGPRMGYLTGIDLKIERPVTPGDQLVIRAKLIKRLGRIMRISAEASVDRRVVARADLTIALAPG